VHLTQQLVDLLYVKRDLVAKLKCSVRLRSERSVTLVPELLSFQIY